MPDVAAACTRFEELGVEFVKRPDDGKMKGLAFIKGVLVALNDAHEHVPADPDGYWIEVLEANNMAKLA